MRSFFYEQEMRSRQHEWSGNALRTPAPRWPGHCSHQKLPRLCGIFAKRLALSTTPRMSWKVSSRTWIPDGRTFPPRSSPLWRLHSGSFPVGNHSCPNGNFSFRAARISKSRAGFRTGSGGRGDGDSLSSASSYATTRLSRAESAGEVRFAESDGRISCVSPMHGWGGSPRDCEFFWNSIG